MNIVHVDVRLATCTMLCKALLFSRVQCVRVLWYFCSLSHLKVFPSTQDQEAMHGESPYNVMFGEFVE